MTTLTLQQMRRSWRAWLGNDDRDAGPGWLGLVWTFAFAMVVAAVFTAFRPVESR